MAAQKKTQRREATRQTIGLVLELDDLRLRQEELERERRLVALEPDDDVISQWVDLAGQQGRWNFVPPPLRARPARLIDTRPGKRAARRREMRRGPVTWRGPQTRYADPPAS